MYKLALSKLIIPKHLTMFIKIKVNLTKKKKEIQIPSRKKYGGEIIIKHTYISSLMVLQ